MTPRLEDRYLHATERTEHIREIVTPEGTALQFGVARAGDRLAAMLLDSILIFVFLLALLIVTVIFAFAGGAELAAVVFTLGFFLVRMFYFTWFELRRSGVTPGKRWMKLRVVDIGGGQLTSEAVLGRNFMREIEFWLPLVFLSSPESQLGVGRGWEVGLALMWVIGLATFPLFNKDRRRVGDYVAGTIVVVLPQAHLRGDLGRKKQATATTEAAEAVEGPRFTFSREQLEFYGIYELEVLEDVLRKPGRARREAVPAVAQKIQQKIGWTAPVSPRDLGTFLRDFYRAQRSHLEHKMLLGQRKERKDVAPEDGSPPAP